MQHSQQHSQQQQSQQNTPYNDHPSRPIATITTMSLPANAASAATNTAHPSSMAQLVQALKSRDLSAQLYALTQLKNLSSSHPRYKDTIREHAAIPPSVALLASRDTQVQEAALALLRSLSVNETNQCAIADAGAIPLLYQHLQTALIGADAHHNQKNHQNNSNNNTLQVDAAATLWNLAVDAQNKQAIAETNGIALLLSVLARTQQQQQQQSQNVSGRLHSGLASEICGALRNLANRPQNLRYITEFDGGIALIASLLRGADTERTQKNAALTLNLCLQHPDAAAQIEEADCYDLLSRLLLQYQVPITTAVDSALVGAPAVVTRAKSHNNNNLMSSLAQGQQWAAEQNLPRLLPVVGGSAVVGAGGRARAGGRGEVATAATSPEANNTNDSCFGTIAWRGLELGPKLGEGSFGVVYRAKYHDYTVAVKLVHESLTEDPSKRDKLMFESRLLSMLHHPNVLLLLGTSVAPDGRPVIVTEYCSQGTLKDVMAETASVLRRLQFARDIINGINWLHAHNVVHRDLKPVNILIDEHYRAKVADFGLSLLFFEGVQCPAFKVTTF